MGCCFSGSDDVSPMKSGRKFNGPVKNRSCTDVICLAIFIAFLAAWAVVAIFAFKYGNPENLIHPVDTWGNVCGGKSKPDKPYLHYFDILKCADAQVLTSGCRTTQICVDKCPTKHINIHSSGDDEIRDNLLCQYNINIRSESMDTIRQLVKSGACPWYQLTTEPILNRCIPTDGNTEKNNLVVSRKSDGTVEFRPLTAFTDYQDYKTNNESLHRATQNLAELMKLRDTGEKIVQDLHKTWPFILAAFAVAILVCFVWIYLMRMFAGLIVYLSIIAVLCLLTFGCIFCFVRYSKLKSGKPIEEIPTLREEFLSNLQSQYDNDPNTWLVLGIICSILLGLLLIVVIFLRSRIRLAVLLIGEASKAVGDVYQVMIYPVVPFLLQILVFAFFLLIAISLASVSTVIYKTNVPSYCDSAECNKARINFKCFPPPQADKGGFVSFDDGQKNQDLIACQTLGKGCPNATCQQVQDVDKLLNWGHFYNIVALIWCMFFLIGLNITTLAGVFGRWYWTLNKKHLPTFIVTNAFCRTTRYHLGSIAFGSLLLTIVRVIRIILEYVDRKLKKYSDNAVIKCIMCCTKCFFYCLENFLKFISRNAYIMIAIYGKNFCQSASKAFALLTRNVLRVVVLDKVTDFLLFFGKLLVVGSVGFLSFLFFAGKLCNTADLFEPLNFFMAPIVVIILGSYMIAASAFSVYDIAIDTLFLCFLEDCERNDGSAERPYFMSKELMKIFGKKKNV